ncbi:MAG: hypothetical protein HY899_11520 [Deltaproteobacteria bacterium]|nr:hypothetical protein [Deltaproteobacteria bacterium]
MTLSASAVSPRGAAFRADVVALAPAWRIAAAALKVFARGSLLVMVVALLLSDEPPTNPLAQMRMFAGLFLAPEAAAWCIARAFAASLSVEDEALVLEQRGRRVEIQTAAVAAVEPWVVPLPAVGLWLRLKSGRRFSEAIALADPAGFVEALVAQGGQPSLGDALSGRVGAYARARVANPHGLFEHPVLKFVVFALVPALPAFRLHQVITYGGTFGEYQTFGLQAYLIGLAIWWVSWAIGLVLFAAVLRAAVELGTVALVLARPAWAVGARKLLEIVGRVFFYVGVPTLLLIRLWPW